MFKKENKTIEKPNKFKIDAKFDKVRDSINDQISEYDEKMSELKQRVIEYKKSGNNLEANRLKESYKKISVFRHKTYEILDKLDNFQFMIDESLTKLELYKTFGDVVNEVSKINLSPEMKEMLKGLSSFEENFTKQFNKLDQMFGTVTQSISSVDQATNQEISSELEVELQNEMKQFDEDVENAANNDSLEWM